MRCVVRAAVLAICLGAGACGSDRQDDSTGSSADPEGDSSGAPGAPARPEAMTGFVIDLIAQHTRDDAPPVAYERFASLPDPDGAANNVDAYASMF